MSSILGQYYFYSVLRSSQHEVPALFYCIYSSQDTDAVKWVYWMWPIQSHVWGVILLSRTRVDSPYSRFCSSVYWCSHLSKSEPHHWTISAVESPDAFQDEPEMSVRKSVVSVSKTLLMIATFAICMDISLSSTLVRHRVCGGKMTHLSFEWL